ncbi:MAG: hypothetical protein RL368_47 [Pseudomonadota bacterium]|jgi:hypothetical protein
MIKGFSELNNFFQHDAFILLNSDNPVNPDFDNKLVIAKIVFLSPTQVI